MACRHKFKEKQTRFNRTSIMLSETVKVLWNDSLGPEYFKMGLKSHAGYAQADPGQFVMVRPADRLYPLLRRPFSIHRLIESRGTVDGIEILYKTVGKGTRALSACRAGDDIDLLGPLGKGFDLPPGAKRIFIVTGGIGVAPMLFLAQTLQKKGLDASDCAVFLGGRTRKDLLCADEFLDLGMQVRVTTDDGSAGDACLVTLPMTDAMKRRPPDIIYACGPMAMLQCVATAAADHGIPCRVSVETVMACGMGACLGCAVGSAVSTETYLHACVDGPVFDAAVLDLAFLDGKP
jgi:dihydroorotate dehydrogenase electron transfer subunit